MKTLLKYGIAAAGIITSGLLQTGCTPSGDQQEKQPNIILFLVDDMGWQDTSVPFWKEKTPFNERYHTPGMERLAREGMKFTQAYASSVCSPTRTSLMTGMNAARHRVTNWTLRRNGSNDQKDDQMEFPVWNMNGLQPADSIENAVAATTLPQLLQDHGYYTIHTGKAHWGAIGTPGADPLNLGFDINIAGHAAGGPGSFWGEKNYSAAWRNGGHIWDVPGLEKYHGSDTYLTEALTLEAVKALQEPVKNDQPFYLYMSHYAVHVPLEADERFADKYRKMGLDKREAAYASMVEGMDKSLRDLMDYLEEEGVADNTIILFMSDNGGLSAHGRGGEPNTHNKPLSSGKGSAYEGGIRVPMLVKWPGKVRPESVCHDYVIIEDFFPTILEMAGIQNANTIQSVDGMSFVPLLLEKENPEKERSLFWHFPNKWGPSGPGIGTTSSIRKGDWKLVYWYKDQHFDLFNIREDIGEEHNLAEENPGKVKALAAELGEWLRETGAQRPVLQNTGEPAPWPDQQEVWDKNNLAMVNSGNVIEKTPVFHYFYKKEQ